MAVPASPEHGNAAAKPRRRVLLDAGNPVYVPALLLLGAAVVPPTVTRFVGEPQVPRRLPFGYIAAGAVLGGVIGAVVAGQLEFETVREFGARPTLQIDLIDESAELTARWGTRCGQKWIQYDRPTSAQTTGTRSVNRACCSDVCVCSQVQPADELSKLSLATWSDMPVSRANGTRARSAP